MPDNPLLIFIPTYNERDNAPQLYTQLRALALTADILFLDDQSPDGTGEVLDGLAQSDPRLFVIHRAGKLGIGSAHLDGIRWAYDHGYQTLITMDCDFTHTPTDLVKMLAQFPGHDLTVGSRHLAHDSLPGWTRWRRILTLAGHLLTKYLLRMPYDATGAFRIYRLTNIPRGIFDLVRSRGYAFFFESLYVLHRNRFVINEVPIVLPARAAGHSKMSFKEIIRSVRFLFAMGVMIYTNPGRFKFSDRGIADRR